MPFYDLEDVKFPRYIIIVLRGKNRIFKGKTDILVTQSGNAGYITKVCLKRQNANYFDKSLMTSMKIKPKNEKTCHFSKKYLKKLDLSVLIASNYSRRFILFKNVGDN